MTTAMTITVGGGGAVSITVDKASTSNEMGGGGGVIILPAPYLALYLSHKYISKLMILHKNLTPWSYYHT